MMFTHNSKVADTEPDWGTLDKGSLPRVAFADMGVAGKKSSWKYPHHWVKGGTKKDKNGVWTDGTLYLHKGGLNAAWAAAKGARSGKKASVSVTRHLQRHRDAVGIGATKAIIDTPWMIEPGWLETIYDIASREGDLEALAQREGEITEDAVLTYGDVAVINVRGPIFRYANLLTKISGATSTEMLARYIGSASKDPAVKRIILDFDSPGGQVTGISELGDIISEAATRKPIVAYVSGVAASAAYWLASATGKIIAADTAIVGSIGVVATFRKTQTDDIEIVSSNAPDKRLDIESKKGRAKIQETLDALADVFVEKVAGYRGVEKEYVLKNFGKGGVVVGKNALAVKMIDQIGTFEQILEGGKAMEITRETIAEKNPELLEALAAEARADLEAENKKLKLEAFKHDLEGLVGAENVDAFVAVYENPTKEAILEVGKVVAKMQGVINALGEAQGTPVVETPRVEETDMERVEAIAKERGISKTDALIEYEKEKGGSE